MFSTLLAFLMVAGFADCRESAQSMPIEKLGSLAKSLPKLPTPQKLPPAGDGIVSFSINAEGRARAIEIQCQSSPIAGEHLRDLISVIRFAVPPTAEADVRHQVALKIEVTDDASVKITDLVAPTTVRP
jgi:hypothetical protein